MPSFFEELPKKSIKFVIRRYKLYQEDLRQKKEQREYENFLNASKSQLEGLLQHHIPNEQFNFRLDPVFQLMEVQNPDGSVTTKQKHVGFNQIPICELEKDGSPVFKAPCVVYRFILYGEIDRSTIVKLREIWLHYLKLNSSKVGIADTYLNDGTRFLVFLLYDKKDERTIRNTLFKLRNP